MLHQLRVQKEGHHRYEAARSAWCDAKSFIINGGNYNFVLKKDMSHSDKLFDMIPYYNKSVMLFWTSDVPTMVQTLQIRYRFQTLYCQDYLTSVEERFREAQPRRDQQIPQRFVS
ncbi:hypothetical protein HYE67_011332 [Fusarium culmorum]|uniref:Uncharacterized protein n=1 Tax=Fusarium culmorum TaxID=5516 RepID=A0A2T4GIB2_FUSCU|nr:hypothetical protein FCULG_00009119 [Fusarium culmorum]QPC69101.1 hypothetical protein HYE67_011332 [Fusarium culmorum]